MSDIDRSWCYDCLQGPIVDPGRVSEGLGKRPCTVTLHRHSAFKKQEAGRHFLKIKKTAFFAEYSEYRKWKSAWFQFCYRYFMFRLTSVPLPVLRHVNPFFHPCNQLLTRNLLILVPLHKSSAVSRSTQM